MMDPDIWDGCEPRPSVSRRRRLSPLRPRVACSKAMVDGNRASQRCWSMLPPGWVRPSVFGPAPLPAASSTSEITTRRSTSSTLLQCSLDGRLLGGRKVASRGVGAVGAAREPGRQWSALRPWCRGAGASPACGVSTTPLGGTPTLAECSRVVCRQQLRRSVRRSHLRPAARPHRWPRGALSRADGLPRRRRWPRTAPPRAEALPRRRRWPDRPPPHPPDTPPCPQPRQRRQTHPPWRCLRTAVNSSRWRATSAVRSTTNGQA